MKKLLSTSLIMLSGILMLAQEPSKIIKGNVSQILGNSRFESDTNTVSNVEFYTSNYGIFGQNIDSNTWGLRWPRNSQNKYLFGGGFWFGAKKWFIDTNSNRVLNKYCTASYEPNGGSSWFTPGKINDETEMTADKYKIYCSSDYNTADGTPKDPTSTLPWPNWITNADNPLEFGTKQNTNVDDVSKRTIADYPLGPSFVSDEDFISVYHDTTLSRYTMGATAARRKGYPLQLQIEERIYSWGKEELKDMVVLHYTVENKSKDTLQDCFFAPIHDIDLKYFVIGGEDNDRVKYYTDSPELNLAVGWTMNNRGEDQKKFGYIGLTLLETPAVDQNFYLRKDKIIYQISEQIGLYSFRNLEIESDPQTDEEMYNYITTIDDEGVGLKNGDNGPGDKRMVMSAGPFNMLPGDKARFAVGLVFALPVKKREADGSTDDIAGTNLSDPSLVNKVRALHKEYYKANTSGVSDESNSSIIINAVYPNPTAKDISVDYSVEQDADVRISIIDQFGTEIQVLYSGVRNAGKHTEQLQVDTDAISSGVYYLQVKIGNETKIKAISIVK